MKLNRIKQSVLYKVLHGHDFEAKFDRAMLDWGSRNENFLELQSCVRLQ